MKKGERNYRVCRRGKLLGFVARVDNEFITVDGTGGWFLGLGGQKNPSGFAVFKDRLAAQDMLKKVRAQRPDLITRSLTVPVYETKQLVRRHK